MRKIKYLLSILLIIGFASFSSFLFTKDIAQAAASSGSQPLTLEVDHYKTLRISGASNISWRSSNSAVASVSGTGKVTGRTYGKATITASYSGRKQTYQVNVIYVRTEAILSSGKSTTLTVYGAKGTPVYSTADEEIATVSEQGKVTAKAPGTTTITTMVDGIVMDTRIVVMDLNTTNAVLELGGWSGSVKTLSVSNATGKIAWSSSNPLVATVSGTGKVTAKGYGSAIVTATVSGKKLTCKVTVLKISKKEFTLKLGETKKLKIYGTDNKVQWTSSKNSVAKVSANGTVSTVSTGKATITGYVDGRKISAVVTVTK